MPIKKIKRTDDGISEDPSEEVEGGADEELEEGEIGLDDSYDEEDDSEEEEDEE